MPLPPSSTPADFAQAFEAAFRRLFPQASATLYPRVLDDVEAMFAGRYLDYQKSDTPYHDLRHTLEVTLCFAEIMEGRQAAAAEPALEPRAFELGLCTALLHDTGYLKLRADLLGTGAKYTFTHVLRSCAVASSYLPPLGVTLEELDGVLGGIRCTGPGVRIDRLHFAHPLESVIGCAVATADYLGQMAAPDYLEALPKLFAEFEESDDYARVPKAQRLYKSVEELIARTPDFWRRSVLPKLENEFRGQLHYLASPYPAGPNPYLLGVEANLARIAPRPASPA